MCVIFVGVGAQSTLGGHDIFARKICMKKLTMPEFYLILPETLAKYPNFYDICRKNLQNSRILRDFCPKNARFLHNNWPKNIFSQILGGHVPPPFSPARRLRLCV